MTNDELRELAAKSTRVVGWYPHSQYDGYHPGKASVRGPYGRWLLVEGGENKPGELGHGVADLYDDAKFAAAAMNNLVHLLDEIDRLKKEVQQLKQDWQDGNEALIVLLSYYRFRNEDNKCGLCTDIKPCNFENCPNDNVKDENV